MQGQQLLGTFGGKVVLQGTDTTDAHLWLDHVTGSGSVDITYDLHIDEVISDQPFWSCPGGSCRGAPSNPVIYKFTVTASDGCEVELCKPGLDGKFGTLNGSAVMFRGDLYTDDYVVTPAPSGIDSTARGSSSSAAGRCARPTHRRPGLQPAAGWRRSSAALWD